MIQPLEKILPYKNEFVIKRFLMSHKMTREEAEQIFEDGLRFLWLSATFDELRKEDPDVPDISIAEGMYIIDEVWHEFVLLTKMYTDFCNENFGRYIHHPPDLHKYFENKKTMGKDKANEIFVSEMVGTVIDYFGEAVAIRWLDTYHKYLPDNHAELTSHHTD